MTKKHGFNLKVTENKDNVLLRIKGGLDGSGACELENVLKRLRNVPKAGRLTLDLSGIRDFDYFGIVHFARAIRRQKKHFHEICLTGLEATTENLFKRFGLENGKVTRAFL